MAELPESAALYRAVQQAIRGEPITKEGLSGEILEAALTFEEIQRQKRARLAKGK